MLSEIRQQSLLGVLASQVGRLSTVMTIICAILIAPLFSIALTATGDTGDLMPHLFQTVLARYVGNTLLLMAGVGFWP